MNLASSPRPGQEISSAFATNDPGDVAGAPADPDIGGRLHLILAERRDFKNPVGHETEAEHAAFQRDIHDQHPRMGCRHGLGKAELQPQIDGRHALPAHIAQAEQIVGAVGDLEGFLIVEDLPDHLDGNGEDFIAQAERHVLGFERYCCHGLCAFSEVCVVGIRSTHGEVKGETLCPCLLGRDRVGGL